MHVYATYSKMNVTAAYPFYISNLRFMISLGYLI